MTEQKHVIIQGGSQVINYIVEFSISAPWELRLLSESGKTVEYSCNGTDLFDCLTTLRAQHLEKRGWLLLCNGARIDVYPSRMSRQMSGGKKAYVMRLGEPARRSDIVDIFDPVEDLSRISTVVEQKKFYKKWLESLG